MDLARFIARRSNRLLSSPSILTGEDGEPLHPHVLGAHGEDLAACYLKQERCRVLYRNYRGPRGGEVDIVCRDDQTLVFVEVKTRTSIEYGRPGSAVNRAKQYLIARGALAWLRLLDFPDIPFRFDIIEIVVAEGQPPEITWIREAFPLPEPLRY